MNCPKCSYPNPQGVSYCQMCYEVFNRSAAERYYHAQKKARRDRGEPITPVTPPPAPSTTDLNVPIRIVTETLPRIDWSAWTQKISEILQYGSRTSIQMARVYTKELGLFAGIVVLGVLVLIYTSPVRRMQLFGNHMEYRFHPKAKVGYLVGFHTEAKIWSERGGRLDTPLDTIEKDEMGTVDLKASAYRADLQESPSHQPTQKIVLDAREWIHSQQGALSQSIPLNHPSLKPFKVILDHHGSILRHDTSFSTRIGRAVVFLLPRWPAGNHRQGDTWEEPVTWVESFGDWKILWRGRLHWKLAGYEPLNDHIYIHLHYRADIAPRIWDAPAWAKSLVSGATYTGTGEGDSLFDTGTHQVISNVYMQDGALTVPIADIYRIPIDQRVGRMPRRRWGERVDPQPGTLVLQVKDKVDIQRR